MDMAGENADGSGESADAPVDMKVPVGVHDPWDALVPLGAGTSPSPTRRMLQYCAFFPLLGFLVTKTDNNTAQK